MSFLDQYKRVRRWYERFMATSKGKVHDLPTDFYQDDLYAFFVNCYHLKDWIKNDPNVPNAVKDEVEGFISVSEELSICADICNGSKHLTLRNPRKDTSTKVGSRHFSLFLGHGPIIHIDYVIESGGQTYDAHSLATNCLAAWEKFIKNHKLITSY